MTDVKHNQSKEDPGERELFETIKETFELAREHEQQAMVKELRTGLPTIPFEDRTELIDHVQNAIGHNVEEELDFRVE